MKRILLTIIVLISALYGRSQKTEFTNAMSEALGQFAQCKTIEDFQSTGNQFARIAGAEKSEWLPLYYHAECYIIMSFMEPSDAAKKDSYVDIAEQSVNKMLELAPKESEAYTLQSMMYSARLVVDPMSRGQKFGMLSAQAIGTALGLEPDNPRAKFTKLRNDMGAAQFFGKDPNDYCPQARELLKSWDNYKVKSPLYPSWGKDQLEELIKECK
ncbi:MAG: hypothetical protein HXX13_18300 [Bacteroidetes bacterium]|nr:hypothetical protein [Bacteroidota bacterium]